MNIFRTAHEMRSWSRAERRAGRAVAFVPTMGALHEGHISLFREGLKRADSLAVSIYVNPTQFGPGEDFARYPRDADGDIAKARGAGSSAVFLPSDGEMYPAGHETRVAVGEIARLLCGASRPGHFQGVATVVAKLFNIVEPSVALFGEKDFQQLAIIRRMVMDLNLPIEIASCPTVREADGLAMSSRNRYLSAEERLAARAIPSALEAAERLVESGERSPQAIIGAARAALEEGVGVRADYVSLVDPETLRDLKDFRRPALLAIAAFVGATRLIDNRLFR